MDSMIIRKTKKSDIPALLSIFDEARGTIKALGIDQWQNGYPSRSVIENDIDREQSYCAELEGKLFATFALLSCGEPTYDKIYEGEWITGEQSYIAIHRVAISLEKRGQGISTAIIDYACNFAKASGKKSLRIDTHRGNIVMRKMLEKHGFVYCGVIYLENGDERVAYERIIK